MNYEDLFESATRVKYRFPFKGMISTEDLWDLPLKDLDSIFKTLNAEVKRRSQEDSLLNTRDLHSEILDRQIEIIKHIVTVKQAEIAATKEAAERKAQKQRIMEIIAKKEDDSLQNMSLDELKKMVEGM